MNLTGPEKPDIDPTVETDIENAIGSIDKGAVTSKFFGDAVIIERPTEVQALPDETPQQTHIRLQKERGRKSS